MEITELPEELYQVLFEFLNLHDLLELRLVCRFFNKQVKSYRVNELFIRLDSDKRPWEFEYWFYRTPGHSFTNILLPSKAFILKRPLFEIERLKCLKFEVHYFEDLDLDYREILNGLVHLVHLELRYRFSPRTKDEESIEVRKRNGKLVLPKLKRLYLDTYFAKKLQLEIDAPKLHDFYWWGNAQRELPQIVLVHPSSVKCLGIYQFEQLSRKLPSLKGIEHLSALKCTGLNGEFLADYPNLKSLTVRHKVQLSDFVNLLKQRFLHKKDLRVYFGGLEITHRNELDLIEQESGCSLPDIDLQKWFVQDKLIENCENLSRDVHATFGVTNIRYDSVIKLRDGVIPDVFFEVFKHVNTVYCYTNVNQTHFIKFLASCQGLKDLRLKNCEIDQKFVDELPRISSLNKLEISKNDRKLDFRFLNRMYNLENFNTDQSIVKHEGLSLNRHRHLSRISFIAHFDNYVATFVVERRAGEKSKRLLKIFVRGDPVLSGPFWSKQEVSIEEVTYELLIEKMKLLEMNHMKNVAKMNWPLVRVCHQMATGLVRRWHCCRHRHPRRAFIFKFLLSFLTLYVLAFTICLGLFLIFERYFYTY